VPAAAVTLFAIFTVDGHHVRADPGHGFDQLVRVSNRAAPCRG